MPVLARIGIAAALALAGAGALFGSTHVEGGGAGEVVLLAALGFGLLLAAGLVLVPAALERVAEHAARLLTGALGANAKASGVADAQILVGDRRYREAYDRLASLADEYPDDATLYVRMMTIAYENLGDDELAERAYARGMREVRTGEGRRRLGRLRDAYRRADA